MIAETLEGEKIAVPGNVVTPSLAAELEKQGVVVSGKEGLYSIRYSARDGRTESIKAQIATRIDSLNDMEPVVSVISELRPRKNGIPDRQLMRDALLFFFGSYNYSVSSKDVGKVEYDKNAMRQVVEYIDTDAEFASVKASPSVIKKGILIDHHYEHKGRSEVESFTYAAPVTLNGKAGIEAVVVQRTNRYKPHCCRIVMPDGSGFDLTPIEKVAHTSRAISQNGDWQQRNATTSNNSISDPILKNNLQIRFSLSDSVEESNGLIAVHNLSAEQLSSSMELGGFPMPSIAIVKSGYNHD